MEERLKACTALSRLLSYPCPGFVEAAEEWCASVASACPEAGPKLESFRALLAAQRDPELEELYTRTFDNTQSAALEVGWHLYGESYERGSFLIRMRGLLREYGIPENGELPDHISHLLALIGCCEDALARELAARAALPALKKVAVSLAAGENPYEAVVDAAIQVLNRLAGKENGCCKPS